MSTTEEQPQEPEQAASMKPSVIRSWCVSWPSVQQLTKHDG